LPLLELPPLELPPLPLPPSFDGSWSSLNVIDT
jgi:hypothetical protein